MTAELKNLPKDYSLYSYQDLGLVLGKYDHDQLLLAASSKEPTDKHIKERAQEALTVKMTFGLHPYEQKNQEQRIQSVLDLARELHESKVTFNARVFCRAIIETIMHESFYGVRGKLKPEQLEMGCNAIKQLTGLSEDDRGWEVQHFKTVFSWYAL